MNFNWFSKAEAIPIPGKITVPDVREKAISLKPKPIIFFSFSDGGSFVANNLHRKLSNDDRFEFILLEGLRINVKNQKRKEEIKRANAFLIFLSTDYVESKVCEYELNLIRERITNKSQVIVVINEKTKLYPIWKKYLHYADFTKGNESKGLEHIKDRLVSFL